MSIREPALAGVRKLSPEITLVEFDAVVLEQGEEFVLKRNASVVLRLICDVSDYIGSF